MCRLGLRALLIGTSIVLLVLSVREPRPAVAMANFANMSGIAYFTVVNIYADQRKGKNLAPVIPIEKTGKFVVGFKQIPGALSHDAVKSIEISGPNGYRLTMNVHRKYDEELNGYVDDQYTKYLWFMAFEKKGFLENGEYSVNAVMADGNKYSFKRPLNYSPALVDSYLKHRHSIRFSPRGVLKSTSPTYRWTTLSSLGGESGIYVFRLANGMKLDPAQLKSFDNPFVLPLYLPVPSSAGLDKSSFKPPVKDGPLAPNKGYRWFTEILDSNNLNQMNVAIFMPMVAVQAKSGTGAPPPPTRGKGYREGLPLQRSS